MNLGRGLALLPPQCAASASGAEDRTPEILAPQNLSRGLVNVAAKLTHNKDVRDLFVDLVEKVSSPVPTPWSPACPVPTPGPQPVLCLSSPSGATCSLGPTVCGTLPL
jgi:hypothetical protein